MFNRLTFCILLIASLNILGQSQPVSSNDPQKHQQTDPYNVETIKEWITESVNHTKWSHQARVDFANAAYESATATGNVSLKFQAMQSLAELYLQEGRFDDALFLFDSVSDFASATDNPELNIYVKNSAGAIYRHRGQFNEALGVIYEAYDLAKANGKENLLPLTLNNLGIIFFNLGDEKKARELIKQAQDIAIEHKDTHQIIQSHIYTGNAFWYEKQFDKAREQYNEGLTLALKSNNIQHLANLYNNMGSVFCEEGDIEQSIDYYNTALKYLDEITLANLRTVILRNVGIAFQADGKPLEALKYVEESMQISESANIKRVTRDNYRTLSRIYHDLGQLEKSNDFLNKYIDLNQELYNDQLLGSVTFFNERVFDAERKEQVYKFKLERNFLILIMVLLALVFIAILTIILLKNFKDKRYHIEKLTAALKEKEVTELALRQSEENYQGFLRTLNEALVVLDNSNRVEFLNNKACKILGIETADQVKGERFEKYLLTLEDEKTFRDKIELQKIGISDSYELKMKNAADDVMWVNISSAPIIDAFQNPNGSVNLITNVTEKKQSEQNLNELTSNLNQKIKQLNCMYDISDISGVPGIIFEEIIEKSLEIIPVGLKYSHDIAVQIMFNDRVFTSKNFRETPWSYIVPIKVQKKKLGYLKVVYLEEKPLINKDPFHFNEKILLKNISEKFGQILEAKNMESVLLESQERLQEVQRLAKIGNYERNLKTNQFHFSDNIFEILEISTDKRRFFDFDKFIELVHPDDKSAVLDFENGYDKSEVKEVVNINYRIISARGMIKHIYSSRKIIADELNEPARIVYTVQDITEQKTNQELKYSIEVALKTAEAKQEFLANMSHEMRTPMNGIMGMVDFLLKTDLTSDQLDYATTIKDSSEGLLNILNDILDLSKIEAGKLELKNKTFSLEQLFDRVKGLFAALTKSKDLTLQIYIDEKIPDKITTDEYRLFQVITNLVSNSVKFSESGDKIIINVIPENIGIDNMMLLIQVIDNGPGIKPEERSSLFKPFSQLDDTLIKKNEGTGLGLAISKRLVELLGGKIDVENNEEKGCTFYFTIKAKLPKKTIEPVKSRKKEIKVNHSDLSGLKILCVDDKVVNQKVIHLMLTYVNCMVTLASNGLEALEQMEKNEFDIILLDIVMPEMDGIETIHEIKRRYTNHPPVIALSANVMEGDKEQYLAEGMNDYLSKPVKAEELYEKLLEWHKNRKSRKLNKEKK